MLLQIHGQTNVMAVNCCVYHLSAVSLTTFCHFFCAYSIFDGHRSEILFCRIHCLAQSRIHIVRFVFAATYKPNTNEFRCQKFIFPLWFSISIFLFLNSSKQNTLLVRRNLAHQHHILLITVMDVIFYQAWCVYVSLMLPFIATWIYYTILFVIWCVGIFCTANNHASITFVCTVQAVASTSENVICMFSAKRLWHFMCRVILWFYIIS